MQNEEIMKQIKSSKDDIISYQNQIIDKNSVQIKTNKQPNDSVKPNENEDKQALVPIAPTSGMVS